MLLEGNEEPEESWRDANLRRFRKVHSKVKKITDSNTFNGMIIFVICINAVFMALETDDHLKATWGYRVFR